MLEPAAEATLDGVNFSPINVLHVDDEVLLLKAAKQILEMQGSFQVETALSVKEAMSKLGEKTFDAIISDYQMPERSGLDFLKDLRSSGNNVPFIVFTGKGGEEEINALNLGASGYLSKAGNPKEVYGELARTVKNAVKAKMAEELQESKKKSRSFFENPRDIIALLDLDGTITDITRAAMKIGLKKDEVVGKNITEFISKKEWWKMFKDRLLILRRKSVNGRMELKTPKGKKLVDYRSSPIIVDNQVVGTQTILRNITENKLTEDLLEESEENYLSIIEQAPDAWITFDLRGIVTSCNTAASTLSGYSKDEIINKHFQELAYLYDNDIQNSMKILDSLLAGKLPEPFELKYHCKNGTSAFGEVHINLMKKEGKLIGFQAIMRDITARKNAEEALRQERETLEMVTKNIDAGLTVISKDYRILWANNVITKVFGSVSGKKCYSVFYQRNSICPECGAKEVFETGKSKAISEKQVFGPDGKPMWMEITVTPIRDENGKIKSVLELGLQISQRKKAEVKLDDMMEELVAINQKLGVVGKLTRHDARNKLSAIINYVYLAKQHLVDNPKALEYLGAVESIIDQMEKIFDFARIYEMLGAEELAYVNIENSVNEAAMLLGLDNVKLVNECQGLMVLADSLLRQLFYNLIDNTLLHGEKITQIRVHYKEKGDCLKLIYEDDGVGIPECEKEKIFIEGYGKGTGYGLNLIQKICKEYGWTLQETGKPSKGAKFIMSIPNMGPNGKPSYKLG